MTEQKKPTQKKATIKDSTKRQKLEKIAALGFASPIASEFSKLNDGLYKMVSDQRRMFEQGTLDMVTASLQGNERKMIDISREIARCGVVHGREVEKNAADVERRVMKAVEESMGRLIESLL